MGCFERLMVPSFSREEIGEAVEHHRLLTMEIEFNTECNFHCLYCYTQRNGSGPDPRPELAPDQFRKVLEQARKLGVRTLVILGGEPMLYPHIFEMLDYVRALGMNVEMFTNGANMTAANATRLHQLDAVVALKMNSFDERIQDILAGTKGAYSQIRTAFDNLKAAGFPGDDGRLGISTVICQQNYDELPRLWGWLRNQKITPYFEMMTPQGGARHHRDNLTVSSEQALDLFLRLSEIDRGYGYEWTPKPPLVGMECLRHQYSCVVTSRGDVYPCVGVTIPVGNVLEKPLAEVIRSSSVIKDLRHYRETLKGPCRECDENATCYGCRGAAYQMTGDYLASDPLCWKNLQRSDQIPALPARVSGLVPHQKPMLLVDRLLEVGEETVVEAEIGEDMPFVDAEGAVDDVAFLEIIAQSVAAHSGFRNFGKGGKEEGFLIGAKGLAVHNRAHKGDRLKIALTKVTEYGDLAVIRGRVSNNGTLLAEGEVKVWRKSGEAPSSV